MGDLVLFPGSRSPPDPFECAVTLAGELIDRAVAEIEALEVPCALEIIAGEAISKLAQTSSPEHALALAAAFGRREG